VWLGIALIGVFNRPWLSAIYQSLLIVIVAFVIRYLAVGWSMMIQAKGSVDRELKDAARLEGATRWQMLRYVDWPQIRGRTAAAWYVVFLLCLWDVESMVLVTPPGGETLALRVFNLLHYGHNAQVNALCLALLIIAILPLLFWKTGTALAAGVEKARGGSRKNHLAQGLLVFIACVMTLSFTGCRPPSAQDETSIHSKLFSRVKIIGTRGTGVGQLNKPRSVAVDRQDNVYVVDMTGRVQKFSGAGAFLLSWQMPQTDLGKPKGMCRDKAGNIIVLEPHYQRVNHFATNGTLVAQWGVSGTNLGQLKLPRSIGVSSRGEIYVSEYGLTERVQRFSLGESLDSGKREGTNLAVEARFISSFGKAGTGPGEFNRPEGLFVDAQDRIYVADSCNHRIQIFSGDGKLIRAYGRPGTGKGELSYPYDICVDAEGRQYVCEFGNSRIQVFDAQDQPIEIIGGPGAQPGFFSNPWSVALDSAGNLYVADSLNHRVQKLIRATQVATSGNATRSSFLSLGFAALVLRLTTPAR
jgi:DNA-binding beta-propeller fold protein YncE